jgi:5-carboxymethyl-2-hydroxymuconate isomerase
MPHIVVEYSNNIGNLVQNSNLLKTIHKVVTDSGLFAPEAVKARALVYSDYVLHGISESFIHVTTSILAGRTLNQRSELNEKIFQTIKNSVPEAEKVSSDIREMDATVYRKD